MLEECLREALEITDSVRRRMTDGDAARDLIDRLEALLARMTRLAAAEPSALTESTQQRVKALYESLQAASQQGSSWIERVALPELETLSRAAKGNSTYRLRGKQS